jgi:hypothetical protein
LRPTEFSNRWVDAGGRGLDQYRVAAERRFRNVNLKFEVFRPTIFA